MEWMINADERRYLDTALRHAEEQLKKPVAMFTRQEMLDELFAQSFSVKRFSLLHANLLKMFSETKNYRAYNAVDSITYADINHTKMFESRFYGDFVTFFDTIKSVTEMLIEKHSFEPGRYEIAESALILAWSGALVTELSGIRRDGINATNQTVTLHNKRVLDVPPVGFEHLLKYSKSSGYGNMLYKASVYLFRSITSGNMTVSGIRTNVSRTFGESPMKIEYNRIYWSGLFNRAYMDEIKNGKIRKDRFLNEEERTKLIGRMERLFQEKYLSPPAAYTRLKQYESYKRHFYSNK